MKEVLGHLIDDERIFAYRGEVNSYQASVRGLAYHIAGHELRHLDALRTRYRLDEGSGMAGVPPSD